ncbi:MAG TPA: hypothetical protein VKJ47_12510, partial [Candidatus Binatia bacterium]|nr:hypothetical protein [Candidatus Binatia bacterium]
LDLLAFLARRPEPARLLLLGTYRPGEADRSGHPLNGIKQELWSHGYCQELALGSLTEEAIAQYLTARFAAAAQGAGPLRGLARLIHRRTDGNPLFMVNVVDYLVAQGGMVERGGQWEVTGGVEKVVAEVPANLRQMIEKQIDQLSAEEQRALEVASVAGVEFSAATVAAGLGIEVVASEEQCARLARRSQFLRSHGVEEWPDGTAAGRYGFLHALYQHVVYERLTAGQRLYLHRQIGECKEAGYGQRVREIAAELAAHFAQGRDYGRAVRYLRQAGENAIRRYAYREAIGHVGRGLKFLKMLPDTCERAQQELALQASLGISLTITKGYAAAEAEGAYNRALELCRQVGETPWLFRVLGGLFDVHLLRGQLRAAREMGEQMLSLARKEQDPMLLLWAHAAVGAASAHLGEWASARIHLEQGISLYDPHKHRTSLGVACLFCLASTLSALGYPDQAWQKVQAALAVAEGQSDSHSLVYALVRTALFHLSFRESYSAQQRAETAIVVATEQEFAHWLAIGTIARGAALAEQGRVEEGIAQMRQGLVAYQATGAETARPWFLALLAAGYGRAGRIDEGLNTLAEALAVMHRTEDRHCEAELYQLKGELTLRQSRVRGPESAVASLRHPIPSTQAEAEAYFLKAIATARRQEAKSLELGATISLARLWQSQGKKAAARRMLAEVYGWFTEGFATKGLQEAKALLQELSGE